MSFFSIPSKKKKEKERKNLKSTRNSIDQCNNLAIYCTLCYKNVKYPSRIRFSTRNNSSHDYYVSVRLIIPSILQLFLPDGRSVIRVAPFFHRDRKSYLTTSRAEARKNRQLFATHHREFRNRSKGDSRLRFRFPLRAVSQFSRPSVSVQSTASTLL